MKRSRVQTKAGRPEGDAAETTDDSGELSSACHTATFCENGDCQRIVYRLGDEPDLCVPGLCEAGPCPNPLPCPDAHAIAPLDEEPEDAGHLVVISEQGDPTLFVGAGPNRRSINLANYDLSPEQTVELLGDNVALAVEVDDRLSQTDEALYGAQLPEPVSSAWARAVESARTDPAEQRTACRGCRGHRERGQPR